MKNWEFIDEQGTFRIKDPHHSNYLYFPLFNESGMVSSITPLLNGDAKIDQHHYILTPVSVEDLHNSRSSRNFWLLINNKETWSAAGNSAKQIFSDEDKVFIEAGFLWHRVLRENLRLGIQAEITSFIPTGKDQIELTKIKLKNTGAKDISLICTAAFPIFGRSADNLRDHRHVTSLLQRVHCLPDGIAVKPTLSFDERGHQINNTPYVMLGCEGEGNTPTGFFPSIEGFIGEGGTLDHPQAITRSELSPVSAGNVINGFEALGGIRFAPVVLTQDETIEYVLILSINEDVAYLRKNYLSSSLFNKKFQQNKLFWQEKQSKLVIKTGDTNFNNWLKWVNFQTILRRQIGNSFLPYHDYGRGGRGWRDLWQDLLTQFFTEPDSIENELWSNFAGVRMDGSNANIIGNLHGEFKADRNNIPRVWMDHGAWPWITVHHYLEQTRNYKFLLREQSYFKDNHYDRCASIDPDWNESHGTVQYSSTGEIYSGTILEHLLIQHLTAFFNVGKNNNIRIEGADWNDGMDMARHNGESVAFTALYASNLRQISEAILKLESSGIHSTLLSKELVSLLDRTGSGINYDIPSEKQKILHRYFSSLHPSNSGEKISISLEKLSIDLKCKADWMFEHLRKNEWIKNKEGYGWFNGYYDDDGKRLEGDHPNGVRMTLPGQVFPLMGKIASSEQAAEIVRSVDHYLLDTKVGGYRLNTNFSELMPKMGRCFGYAFGHKENGAIFSHMDVLYAYALYVNNYVQEGWQTLKRMYEYFINFKACHIYPGIPEYINPLGRGMYPYLTGAASWYIYTLVTQAFGINGDNGDLSLKPKLVRSQFDSKGSASLFMFFHGKQLLFLFQNPFLLDHGFYHVGTIHLDGNQLDLLKGENSIPKEIIQKLDPKKIHKITIKLVQMGEGHENS